MDPLAKQPVGPSDGAPPLDAERPHRQRGPSAVPVLLLFGFCFFGMALSTSFFERMDAMFGFQRLVATALGFLFLYMAWASKVIGRLRERLLDLAEEILKIFYGPDFRRERQAIAILIRAMESDNISVRRSSREHLMRLTGVDQGDDPAAWAQWWEFNRSTFRSPGKRGDTDGSS